MSIINDLKYIINDYIIMLIITNGCRRCAVLPEQVNPAAHSSRRSPLPNRPPPPRLSRPPNRLSPHLTFENVATVTESTPLLAALAAMMEHRISALPVIDADGRPVAVNTQRCGFGAGCGQTERVEGDERGGRNRRGDWGGM